jgi:hypothetical protein
MSLYTVCTSLIKHCGKPKNVKYLTNVLFVFTQNNSKKICLDKKGILLEEYKNIAMKSEPLRIWIELLTSKKIPGVEFVEINVGFDSIKNLTLNICASTFDKNLAVKSKQDYFELKDYLDKNGINLLDKDDIIEDFVGIKNIITASDGGQISLGTNSPNVINGKND